METEPLASTITTANSLLVSNLLNMMTDIDHVTNSPRSLLNLGSQIDTSYCNNLHTDQLHEITAVHKFTINVKK